MSEFVLGRALRAADEVIQEHETVSLDRADWDLFMDALDNPPKPNGSLRKAFAEHKKRRDQPPGPRYHTAR